MLFWHWMALGFGLMAIELLLPSFFFLWLGTAALAVGVVLLVFPDLNWEVQWTLFAVLGVAAFYLSHTMMKAKRKQLEAAGGTLNKRGSAMAGQIVTLETAIVNGRGKANVGDSQWSVEGPDLPQGARVKIISADGTVLKVEKI